MTVRLILCDDSELMRTALALLLGTDPGVEVVGEAADGDEAVAVAVRLRPDVAVVDVRMPGTGGIGATARIAAAAPGTRVLLLTSHRDEDEVTAGLRAGAAGFLLKDGTSARLLDAVHAVAAGQTVLDPAVTDALVRRHVLEPAAPGPAAPEPATPGLTGREREVLTLLGRGRSNREIAAELFLAESTVKTYVSRLFATLGVRDRAQAVVAAHRLGLVDPGAGGHPAR